MSARITLSGRPSTSMQRGRSTPLLLVLSVTAIMVTGCTVYGQGPTDDSAPDEDVQVQTDGSEVEDDTSDDEVIDDEEVDDETIDDGTSSDSGDGDEVIQQAGDELAIAICDQARVAWGRGYVYEIENDVARIRQLNLERSEPDGLYWQVWQVVDAWDGYVALSNDPELSDGGQAVVAAVENLIEYCDMLAL